jgi:tetratricopeptide (TPR) repeat protein
MSSKDPKWESSLTASSENNGAESQSDSREESAEQPIRLSVKGAVRETGRHAKFEFNVTPGMNTATFEKESMLKEQLESVDFYIEQGFLEVAFSTLERLEMVFPNHPLISERLDRMASMEMNAQIGQAPPAPSAPPELKEKAPEPEIAAAPSASADQQAQDLSSVPEFRVQSTGELVEPEGLRDIEVNVDANMDITIEPITDDIAVLPVQQTEEEDQSFAPVDLDAGLERHEEDHAKVADKTAIDVIVDASVDNSAATDQSSASTSAAQIDAAAIVSVPNLKMPENPKLTVEVADAISFDPPDAMFATISDDDQIYEKIESEPAVDFNAVQNGLQSLFEELEGELSESDEADFQSHYNVGQAYFDIELFDDAVEEFQLAYRSLQNASSHPRAFQCCMMLGRCFHFKEMPRPALIWLRRALDSQGRADDEYREARYLLANVHADLGERERALELYEQIARSAPDYKDIAEKIAKITSQS